MIEGDGWGYDSYHSVRVIYQGHGGSGYDWDLIAIVRNEKGEYAVYTDSGCSCSGPYEGAPENYDLAWNADLMEVIRQARQEIRTAWYYNAAEKAEELSELSTLRYREGLK